MNSLGEPETTRIKPVRTSKVNLHNPIAKDDIMNKLNKIAIAVALSLGLAVTAFAQPGQMGGNMGQGMQRGMGQGQMQMRSAKTPEERQKLAEANRAEMEKRATEKGITLPEHSGPQGRGMGPNAAHTH